MRPVPGVFPGVAEINYGENQKQYRPLPAVRSAGPMQIVTSRWRLSLLERLTVLVTGSVYVQQCTFGHKLQPLALEVSPALAEGRHFEDRDPIE